MTKRVTALLLVVVMLFSFTYASAERSLDELVKEYKQLAKEEKRLEILGEKFSTAYTYPLNAYKEEYGLLAEPELPRITEENQDQYVGTIFLLTGRIYNVENDREVYMTMEDGREAIFLFSYTKDGEDVWLKPLPKVGDTVNIYGSFIYLYREVHPVLVAGASQYISDRSIEVYGRSE